jgi:hypothetical protein
LTRAAVAGLVLTVVLAGVALAATITVDGTREAAWDSGGSQSDLNENGGPPTGDDITNDGVDIRTIEWTNDTANFYFLIDTYVDTTWDLLGPNDAYVWFCVNNDNQSGTGSTYPGVCLSDGYDRYILVQGGPSLTVSVFDENFAPVAASTNVSTTGTVTELSIDLASLGFSGSNCGSAPTGVYMDGRTSDPDDNVQDFGDIPVTCGTPSAVTLSSMEAESQVDGVVRNLWALAGLIGMGSMGMLALAKRRLK